MANPPRCQRRRRFAAILFGVAVSAIFLYLLLSKIDAARVVAEILSVRVGVLALGLVTTALGFLAMAARSAVLLRPLHRYPYPLLVKSVLLGFTGNNVLPLRAGELLRVDYLARHGGQPHSACLAVVGVERLLDLCCLVLIFFGVLPFAMVEMPSAAAIAPGAAGVLAALAGLILVSRDRERFLALCRWLTAWMGTAASGWLVAMAARFARGLSALSSPAAAAAAFVFSCFYWLAIMATVRVALWAFGLDLPWHAPAVVLIFLAFGTALPSAPAFIGTYHYFAALAFTLMGVEEARATSIAIVLHAAGIVPYTLLGIALLLGEIVRSGAGAGAGSGAPGDHPDDAGAADDGSRRVEQP